MGDFFYDVGMITICFVTALGCKKLAEYFHNKRRGLYESKKVYRAADKFSEGVPSEDVQALLKNCLEFDGEDAETVLSLSLPHRKDKDGGYRAFIRSVNRVLGENVYSERPRVH